jgi:hypothetical protein
MTVYTTQTLVSDVTYGTASGNYDGSSQDWYSDAVPAANYYGGQGSLQTMTLRLQDFSGVIKIEASLNDLKDSALWFEVATHGDGSTLETGTFPINVVGNFTWLRAHITGFESGTIQAITAAYL